MLKYTLKLTYSRACWGIQHFLETEKLYKINGWSFMLIVEFLKLWMFENIENIVVEEVEERVNVEHSEYR